MVIADAQFQMVAQHCLEERFLRNLPLTKVPYQLLHGWIFQEYINRFMIGLKPD
jgi:hypothetical protein